jgi:hypothetical protein
MVLALLFDDAAEMQRLNRGQVSFNWLERFAVARYGKDVTLGLWAWRTLLHDATYYKLYPNNGKVGRNYDLVIRHILTGQTREEWIDAGGSVDRLHCPLLWVIDIDSLKSQYHKLYMHGDNYCTDGHNHWRYRSDRGYSTDMRLLDAKELEDQASVQGITPCIFAVIHEWVITWL